MLLSSEPLYAGRILLKGGRILSPETAQQPELDFIGDMLIADGVIQEIAATIPETAADHVIQLSPEQWITPGLIDVHVHFRDPGQTRKEDTRSGSTAAAAGGFTSVCIMPNTVPAIDTLETLALVQAKTKASSLVEIYPVAAITRDLAGEQLSDIGSLIQAGAVAVTDDGHCLKNPHLMRQALQYTAMFGVPVVCHAEDSCLSAGGCMNEGPTATRLGLKGIPNTAESVIVARDIELVRQVGGRVHFAHLSTKEAIALVRQAKAEGLSVTAETAPHYLVLTDESVASGTTAYNPNVKMNPPLRSKADQDALIAAVLDGTIDVIATDHAPHTPDEKRLPFDQAPNGVIGLETSLAIMLTHFVHTQRLTPLALIERMSTRAAEIFKLPGGALARGGVANITVIDPNQTWTVEPNAFYSRSRNTPFSGWSLQGRAIMTFVHGRRTFTLDQTLAPFKTPQPEQALV